MDGKRLEGKLILQQYLINQFKKIINESDTKDEIAQRFNEFLVSYYESELIALNQKIENEKLRQSLMERYHP